MVAGVLFSWRVVLLVLGVFVSLSRAVEVRSPTLAKRVSPQPPNGTIELHHDPDTSSWYLLVSLNPTNYSLTSGNHTILGKTNPLSTVTLFFTVPQIGYDGRYYYYDILSTPIAFEHHIDDPLTDLYVFNLQNDCTPDVQCFPNDLDVNGPTTFPSGAYNLGTGTNGTAHVYGGSVDLNKLVNVTGLAYDSKTYLNVAPTIITEAPAPTSTAA